MASSSVRVVRAEGDPSARQIDRPCRPLFPEGFHETQLFVNVLADQENDADVLAPGALPR